MTRIQAGNPAPHFQTNDIFGNPIRLEGNGYWRLLSFLRNGACALCNLRVHQLIQHQPDWQRLGLEVIAVFESPTASIRQYVGRQGAPFPIISDPQANLYDLYGVESSAEKIEQTMQMPETTQVIQQAAANGFVLTPEEDSNFNRIPADFLIDPDGLVRQAHYAVHLTDHLPISLIKETIQAHVPSLRR